MNYYYNLNLNLNENLYEFYEWEDYEILNVSKVPFFKVKQEVLKDLFLYKVKVDKDFLEKIHNKSLNSENISYLALFCDTKNVVAISFLENGSTLYKSKLDIESDLTICELSYNIENYDLKYEKLKKDYKHFYNLRKDEETKKIVLKEINDLYQNKSEEKLKYLYLELTDKLIDDIDFIYQEFLKIINDNKMKDLKKIYDIIEFTYKKEH